MALPLSPLPKYATVESLKHPNHCRLTYELNYTIILISNTSPHWHIHAKN